MGTTQPTTDSLQAADLVGWYCWSWSSFSLTLARMLMLTRMLTRMLARMLARMLDSLLLDFLSQLHHRMMCPHCRLHRFPEMGVAQVQGHSDCFCKCAWSLLASWPWASSSSWKWLKE
jgi:hypothetical protein